MNKFITIITLTLTVLLGACSIKGSRYGATKVGIATGAATGAAIGSFSPLGFGVGTAIGTVAGGIIGYDIDKKKTPHTLLEHKLENNGVQIYTVGDTTRILFATNDIFHGRSPRLHKENAKDLLQVTQQYLNTFGDLRLTIIGHTDSMGCANRNLSLSRERAHIIKKELINLGLNAERFVVAEGYGETYPIINNNDLERRQLNNRIEIVVAPYVE